MIDLGCGSGELTVALADRLDVEDAVGVDASPSMLQRRAAAGPRRPTLPTGRYRTVGSTTTRRSHRRQRQPAMGPRPPRRARPVDSEPPPAAAQSPVQVPANHDHPSHTCSSAVADREPFFSHGRTPPPDPVADNVLRPEQYAELLHELGIAEPHVRLQVYPQLMESTAAVVEWTSGTSLTRFFEVFPDELHDPSSRHIAANCSPRRRREPYFYAFKRILMAGRLTA